MSESEETPVPSRRPQARLPLSTLATEVFSIVLGVLLALGVNEWRQERSNRQLAEQARANLFAELEANRNHLQQVYKSNLVFQRQVAGELKEGEPAVIYNPRGVCKIRPGMWPGIPVRCTI